MDEQRFGRFTRSLAAAHTRRAALVALAMLAAGGTEVTAKGKKKKPKKRKGPPPPPPVPVCDANCQGNARVNQCFTYYPTTFCDGCEGDYASRRCQYCNELRDRCCPRAYYSWDAFRACWGF